MADADNQGAEQAFAQDVRAGLGQVRKVIPARWFYDWRGSELFEAITELPEYYPTRTETALLAGCAVGIAQTTGPGRAVVEFGSGSSVKTPLLLRAIAPSAYVPVDISAEFLGDAAARLAADFPGLSVHPLAADFTRPFRVPAAVGDAGRLGFFPGSTIGNLAPAPAVDLLRGFGRTLGTGALLTIGFDLAPSPTKPLAMVCAAYDDAAGVTADDILAVADRSPAKQGRLLPGSHIPVVTPEALLALAPDDILILPWNIGAEVTAQLRRAGFAGGLFTAVPAMRSWP